MGIIATPFRRVRIEYDGTDLVYLLAAEQDRKAGDLLAAVQFILPTAAHQPHREALVT